MENDGVIKGEDGCRYIKSAVCGYTVGDAWDDGASGQVTYIGICYGSYAVHSIITTYKREGSDGSVMSRQHGGNNQSFELVDLEGPLTWVSGYYGDNGDKQPVIRSLKFGTAESSYGPFGYKGGEPFSFRSTGTEIRGFHGYSSDVLHGIGVYILCPHARFIDEPPCPLTRIDLPPWI